MRLACSTRSFPQDRLQIALAKVEWSGFPAVELDLRTEPLPDPEELRASLRAKELELVAVHAGALPTAPPGDSVEEPILDQIARVGRTAALARALDGSLLVVEAPDEGDLDGLARALRLLSGALAESIIDVCVVNRRGTLVASPEDFAGLAGAVEKASLSLSLALDPGEAVLAGWDPGDLDRLPALPRHVYLNDARLGGLLPPGEGDVDWPALIGALRQRGYDRALSLALEGADPWAVEPIAREVRETAEAWLP